MPYKESVRVRMMKEQEDKFDVDPDWVMPQVADLVPEAEVLINRCASSTTRISIHQALACGCSESPCDAGSVGQRRAGS